MTTLTKIILDAENIPHVDIDFMNNTHFEEIEMVKELGICIAAYQENDTHTTDEAKNITELLQAWLQHTQAHFARENELMQETNFPMYSVHSGEHEIALDNMAGIVKSWRDINDIAPLADYVFNIWPAWFNGHVDSMDMITARFAVMHGYDPHT